MIDEETGEAFCEWCWADFGTEEEVRDHERDCWERFQGGGEYIRQRVASGPSAGAEGAARAPGGGHLIPVDEHDEVLPAPVS
jgi:hypothetical protein